MWFEILPPAAIIASAMAFPGIGMLIINKLFLGNCFRRRLVFPYERRLYFRDTRLTGYSYIQQGLECIQDDVDEDQVDKSSTSFGKEESGTNEIDDCSYRMKTKSTKPIVPEILGLFDKNIQSDKNVEKNEKS